MFVSFFVTSAFARNSFDFYIVEVQCNAAPNFLRFEFRPVDTKGNFQGRGGEQYLDFKLDCKSSVDRNTIICTSDMEVSALISMDGDGVVTAKFNGRYFKNKKVGCIVEM